MKPGGFKKFERNLFSITFLRNPFKLINTNLSETLRKYPSATYTLRICNKTFKVPGTDITLYPGESVAIPIAGVHMDPEYYPHPKKFDPDRFTPENKAKRHRMAFLAFGEGPRHCVGMRLGMMLTKMAIAAIVNKFRVTISDTGNTSIQLSEKTVLLEVVGGIWVNFSKV